jgi:hypothetical protein
LREILTLDSFFAEQFGQVELKYGSGNQELAELSAVNRNNK